MKKLFFALVAVIVFASCTASPVKKLMKLHDEITAIQDKGGDEDALDKKVREIDKLIKENRRYKLTDDDHKTLNDLMESLAERTEGELSEDLMDDIDDCKTLGQVANALDIDEFNDYETLHKFVNGLFRTPIDTFIEVFKEYNATYTKAQKLQEKGKYEKADNLVEKYHQLEEKIVTIYDEIKDYQLTSHDRKVLKDYFKSVAKEENGWDISDQKLVEALKRCKSFKDTERIDLYDLREDGDYYEDHDDYYEEAVEAPAETAEAATEAEALMADELANAAIDAAKDAAIAAINAY